jgi:spermidine synthase
VPDFSLKIDSPEEPEYDAGAVELGQHEVLIEEYSGMRMMSFNGDQLQSAMKVNRPHELAVAYTQRMMAFLLFHPTPQRIVTIGLGGGSLAKFMYNEMPDSSIVVVEINPKVLETARSHFYLPQDDERLRVVIADGSHYVASHKGAADILIVDGFGLKGQSPSLCTQSFYDDCWAALRPGGVLVVNLLGPPEDVEVSLKRIHACFGDSVLTLSSREDDNLVVFGCQGAPTFARDAQLIDRAEALKDRYGLVFPRFAQTIKRWSLMGFSPEAQCVDAAE